MNIGNITSNNFNLDNNGKDIQIEVYEQLIEQLQQENQELKKHLEILKQCNLKTIEDYKRYYEDATKEQILADTYIEYCAYVNLAHEYSNTRLVRERLEENQGIGGKMNKEDIEELKREIKALKQANIEYKDRIDKALEDIKEYKEMNFSKYYENEIEIELIDKILEILKGKDNV